MRKILDREAYEHPTTPTYNIKNQINAIMDITVCYRTDTKSIRGGKYRNS